MQISLSVPSATENEYNFFKVGMTEWSQLNRAQCRPLAVVSLVWQCNHVSHAGAEQFCPFQRSHWVTPTECLCTCTGTRLCLACHISQPDELRHPCCPVCSGQFSGFLASRRLTTCMTGLLLSQENCHAGRSLREHGGSLVLSLKINMKKIIRNQACGFCFTDC